MEDLDRLPRKLAAIMYADVAEYSRLTGDDEDATHRRLREHLDLISANVEQNRGQVMHYAGDAVLARFEAVVDALACAAYIQAELESLNSPLPADSRVLFRVGVNLGDVIEDRGDIYGEGVNIAARLQGLAEPGGICISESVRTAVGGKLALEYVSLGEHQVKNIEKPVRAYRVVGSGARAGVPDMESAPQGITILVADDHALIREALKNVLAALDEHVTVYEAHDSASAIIQADTCGDLDLVLLDLDLPGVGGFEVLKQLRRSHPATPVVVLSAHEERNIVLETLNCGAMGFIPKSSANEVMLSALRLVLSGGQYLPPQVLAAGAETTGKGVSAETPESGDGSKTTTPADLGLTDRQCQVLALLMEGKSNKLICRELDVAERTVKIHVSAVLKALNVTSRTQAVIAAERLGLTF